MRWDDADGTPKMLLRNEHISSHPLAVDFPQHGRSTDPVGTEQCLLSLSFFQRSRFTRFPTPGIQSRLFLQMSGSPDASSILSLLDLELGVHASGRLL